MKKINAPYGGMLFHGTSLKAAKRIIKEKVIRASRASFASFTADPGTAVLYKLYRDKHDKGGVILCFPASSVDPRNVSRDPVHLRHQMAYLHLGDIQVSEIERTTSRARRNQN
jgi:hypothetical protein